MTSIKWATRTVGSTRSGESGVGRALDRWCEGLAAAFTWFAGAVRPPRRFQLRTAAAPFVLHTMSNRGAQNAIQLPDAPEKGVPAEVLQQTRGSVIEVIVPPAAILERRLDPLPSESRPYVESVIQHRIETLLPWPAAEVVRNVDIRDRDDGFLDVSVRATARPAIAQALALGAACGARAVIVTPHGSSRAGNTPAPGSISVPIGASNVGALAVARYAIVGLLVAAAVIVGWTTYTHWSLASEVAGLDEAIAERRASLKRAADLRDRGGSSGIEAKKQQAVIAVVVMEDLSAILPDDTHLTELSLDGGRLRLSGVSARATEIVSLLEGSGKFRNAAFYAPTTRLAGRAGDRFSIEAVVVAPHVRVTP